jgi:phage FluMu protein Com
MNDKTLICNRCGKILEQFGTDQVGKYMKCKTCKTITNGKET